MFTERPAMTLAVVMGRKATKQTNKLQSLTIKTLPYPNL